MGVFYSSESFTIAGVTSDLTETLTSEDDDT